MTDPKVQKFLDQMKRVRQRKAEIKARQIKQLQKARHILYLKRLKNRNGKGMPFKVEKPKKKKHKYLRKMLKEYAQNQQKGNKTGIKKPEKRNISEQ